MPNQINECLDRRIRVDGDVGIARFDIDDEQRVKERLALAKRAKQKVDNFYIRVGSRPLPFLLVIEKEDVPLEISEKEGSGKFVYNVEVDSRTLIPTVCTMHPSSEFSRLRRRHPNSSRKQVELEALLRYEWMIMHEASHFHNSLFLNIFRPKWFDEGLATYVEIEESEERTISLKRRLREGHKLRAQRLANLPSFIPLYSCHEYDSWIAANKKAMEFSSECSYYNLVYAVVAEMIESSGIPKFRDLIGEYFRKRGLTDREVLEGLGFILPKEYSLNPQAYLEGKLKDISEVLLVANRPSQSELFNLENFDKFFQSNFFDVYNKFRQWIG